MINEVKLTKATVLDCEEIYQMQVIAFAALLDKYQDYLKELQNR